MSVSQSAFLSPDEIRANFSRAMSLMYRNEVPAYGTLMELVEAVNSRHLEQNPALRESLDNVDALERLSEERHGAIRVGTAAELNFMRRLFAIMGMYPVSYYDLSVAGIPVHSTAFRPVTEDAIKKSPFRVFTSLLRLDLIKDEALHDEAAAALAARDIFTAHARQLVEQAENDGGLNKADAETFVQEALETFRWHDKATVSHELYQRLLKAHRLIADVVSFKGPHINHLTPRTLDIDAAQRLMPEYGIDPKETIEGPPSRAHAILLRQTSFKALEEPIAFQSTDGDWKQGTHTARFGEIEQRGIALTPKGRALYDRLLNEAQARSKGKLPAEADADFAGVFKVFPDDHAVMRANGLAYFEYTLTDAGKRAALDGGASSSIDNLIQSGFVGLHPIVYEDFLPVSAAGIFQSNLGKDAAQAFEISPNIKAFEEALGAEVIDEFALYAEMERQSIERCLQRLRHPVKAA